MSVRVGQVVAVDFLDHVEDGCRPLPFTVYGRVVSVSRKALVIDSWAHRDKRTRRQPDNLTTFCILRSAILQVRRLKEVDHA